MSEKNRGLFRSLKDRFSRKKINHLFQDLTSVDKRLVLQLAHRRIPSWRQFKHLPRYLNSRDRLIIWALTATITVGLVAMTIGVFGNNTEVVPKAGGNYVEATIGVPRYINPVLAATNDADNDLVSLIFSGLMRFDSEGKLLTDLSESYQVSDDGLTYTFQLKRLIEWHDGTAFTANDVAATFGYIKNPAWKSPYQSRFKNVSIETPDDQTVKFTLQEPYAPFLPMLTIGILPAHLWEEVMPENAGRAELNVKPVGTGPFRFKSLIKDRQGTVKSLTLTRNDRYFGKKPYLETVTFRYYQDYSSATDALLHKKVDGISFLPAEAKEKVNELRTVNDYALKLPQYTAIFFNTSNNIALRTAEVRQALTMAIDRKAILRDALNEEGIPVHGPILPNFIGYNAGVKQYGYDPVAAGKLLDDAGYVMNASGFREKETTVGKQVTKQELKVTLTTVDTKENMAVAQMIREYWDKIGVSAELDIVSAGMIQKERIRPRGYEALLYGEIIGPDTDPFPFWHSSQRAAPGLNLANYNNRRVDELLELGRMTSDENERVSHYREFQEILTGDAAAIFLYSPTYSYIISRNIKGVKSAVIMSPTDRFASIANWHIKTERVWKK